jgi:hypothetical protein
LFRCLPEYRARPMIGECGAVRSLREGMFQDGGYVEIMHKRGSGKLVLLPSLGLRRHLPKNPFFTWHANSWFY